MGTNVGGIAEQIEDGVNGLLVPPEDPMALADALEKVVGDPSYRYNLARTAWDTAKKRIPCNGSFRSLRKLILELNRSLGRS